MTDFNSTETASTGENQASVKNTPAIKHGWLRALLQLFAWFIVYTIVTGVAAILVVLISGQDLSSIMTDEADIIKTMGVGQMTIVSFLGFLGTILSVWIFRRFIDRKSMVSLGLTFENYRNDLIAGMGWGIALIVIGFVVLYLSGMLKIVGTSFNLLDLILYFILFIIAAFNEEILVRGYILSNLMDSMNKYVALIVSSVLFAALHLANANMSVIAFINLVLAGLILGIYYIHKRNLWFPIGIHLTWNFFQGPVFGFEVSGNKTGSIILQEVNGSDLLTGGEFGLEGSLIATVSIILMTLVIHFRHRQAN